MAELGNALVDHYLLTESGYYSKPILISDSVNNSNITIFKAILQEAEVPNRNGRIYTKKAIDEALHRQMIQEKILHKTWFGECSHPFEDTLKRQTYMEFERYTHVIAKVWWEDNLLWAIIETLDTRLGRDFRGIIRQGCDVSFSMRGVGGDVSKRNGYEYIDSNLYIMTYDTVGFPSHAPAYINEVIKEDYNPFTSKEVYEKALKESAEYNNSKTMISFNDTDIKKIFMESAEDAIIKEIERANKTSKTINEETNTKKYYSDTISILDRNFK